MISAIVAAGLIFSILTYQYYMRNSSDIQHIAVEHIQSTTLVKVSDLAQILKNKLDLVTINLEMLFLFSRINRPTFGVREGFVEFSSKNNH